MEYKYGIIIALLGEMKHFLATLTKIRFMISFND
jgi:hypothetical protein